jgi:hypothetical protein
MVKASSGKSAIASAAYQSGEKLHSERTGESYHYTGKEEIEYEEVLLPPNAPKAFLNRELLWNSVEASNPRSNACYARQFVIAIPNEWTREESIERAREFIEHSLVNRGMIADWAYHEKQGQDGESDNHHIHVMCTTRHVKPDGSFEAMEKKEYARDDDGNKIPVIDPNTGLQKVRVRERNGHRSEEKIWKQVTVQTNEWKSQTFLKQLKQEWADTCNQYLSESERIDPRSHKERGLETLPMLHEGSCVREMEKRGIKTDIHQENLERQQYNDTVNKLKTKNQSAREQLDIAIRTIIDQEVYDGTRVKGQTNSYGRSTGNYKRIPSDNQSVAIRNRKSSEKDKFIVSSQSVAELSREELNRLIERTTSINSFSSEIHDDNDTIVHKRRHRF